MIFLPVAAEVATKNKAKPGPGQYGGAALTLFLQSAKASEMWFPPLELQRAVPSAAERSSDKRKGVNHHAKVLLGPLLWFLTVCVSPDQPRGTSTG